MTFECGPCPGERTSQSNLRLVEYVVVESLASNSWAFFDSWLYIVALLLASVSAIRDEIKERKTVRKVFIRASRRVQFPERFLQKALRLLFLRVQLCHRLKEVKFYLTQRLILPKRGPSGTKIIISPTSLFSLAIIARNFALIALF